MRPRRYFDVAGPCLPDLHYLLPPERRLPQLGTLIEQRRCFAIGTVAHCGKSTLLRALAARLRSEKQFAAVVASCEVGQTIEPDVEGSMTAILSALRMEAAIQLPEALRPPQIGREQPVANRMLDLLQRWTRLCPRPVVLLLDEVATLSGELLGTLLQQLQAGLAIEREGSLHAIGLAGDFRPFGSSLLRDFPAEPFTLRNFLSAEVAELYTQHTGDTGQVFEDAALERAFDLTQGQPWLVNALARQCVEVLAPDPAQKITREIVDAAKELLIQRRDNHLDSLIYHLREPRVRRVVAPILGGDPLPVDLHDDDVAYSVDLGLVRAGTNGLELANPIYAEIVPRALTQLLEYSLVLPSPSYVDKGGRLDFAKLLHDFRAFWLVNAEAFLERAPYSEAAAQLVFMAFLHKVVNGGGTIERELAVGRGRVDLCIRWPYLENGQKKTQNQAIELKVWRDGAGNPLEAGVEQLAGYLERLGLQQGTLLIFDTRKAAPSLPERQRTEVRQHRGLAIDVCWL